MCYVASDLGLHCLHMSHKKDTSLIWFMLLINFLTDRSKAVFLLRIFFFFLLFVFVYAILSSWLLIAAMWSPIGKRLTSWLSCVCNVFLCFVPFQCGALGRRGA